MPARGNTPTRPLNDARKRRRPARELAATAAGSWSFAALLLAAEYTPQADHAPRLMRGLAWAVAGGALLLGLAALTARAAAALIDTIARDGSARQTLRAAGDAHLDSHHAALRAVAQQAAAAPQHAARGIGELHLLDSARRRQHRGAAN